MAESDDQQKKGEKQPSYEEEEEGLDKTRMDLGVSPHDDTFDEMKVDTVEEITAGEETLRPSGSFFQNLLNTLKSVLFRRPKERKKRKKRFFEAVGKGLLLVFFCLFAGLVVFAGLALFLSKPGEAPYLTLMNRDVDALMNVLWLFFLGFEIVLILLTFPPPFFFRWTALAFVLLGLCGFGSNLVSDIPLRASWLGSGLFQKIPLFFLQPVYLTLHLFLPLIFLFFLGLLVFRKAGRGSLSSVVHLVFLAMTIALGSLLFHQSRVPSLVTLLFTPPVAVGSAETVVSGLRVAVTTTNLSRAKAGDGDVRYRFELDSISPSPNKKNLLLTVSDLSGYPVMFLNKGDLSLTVENEKNATWDMRQENRAGRYRIEFSPGGLKPSGKIEGKEGEPKAARIEILAPLEGDSFWDEISTIVRVDIPPGQNQPIVRFLMDDQEIGIKEAPPYQLTWDATGLAPGEHQLKIQGAPSLVHEIRLIRQEHPLLSFARPGLGEFLATETPVEVLIGEGEEFQEVELLLDGSPIYSMRASPFVWTWDTRSLDSGNHILVAHGKSKSGKALTDWVLVSTGEGGLKVEPEMPGKGNLPFGKIVFVFDASMSQWDAWGQKSKWDWQREGIFSEAIMASPLKKSQVGIVLVGSRDSQDRQNCQDAEWLLKPSPYNREKIESQLQERSPKGISAPISGLEKALERQPNKIVLLTDGWESACGTGRLEGLVKKIAQQKTLVDLVVMGEVSRESLARLHKLGGALGVEVMTVEKGEDLASAIAPLLVPNVQVISDGKIVSRSPLGADVSRLRPGPYLLRLQTSAGFGERPVTVRNGFVLSVKPRWEGKEIRTEEEYLPF